MAIEPVAFFVVSVREGAVVGQPIIGSRVIILFRAANIGDRFAVTFWFQLFASTRSPQIRSESLVFLD
jgi:hypothetical protein